MIHIEDCLYIGNRREVFWDDTMLDTDPEKTTTVFRLHEPVQRECVLTLDLPWDTPPNAYLCVIQDGDVYRMYLRSANLSYAESRDGIHWERPNLGIVSWNGSKDNNILIDGKDYPFDGTRVFLDENPACPPEERYKLAGSFGPPGKVRLHIFAGADGVHFRYLGMLPLEGSFDSVNTVFWNRQTGKYECFFRDFHPSGDPSYPLRTRDIRVSSSKDLFSGWAEPKPLIYEQQVDWHMYTNSIMKYDRADHVYIGFPARYVERQAWTDNYEELCGLEKRRERFDPADPRRALAVTDTLFMTSRDGYFWKRYPDAFLRPGPEHPTNWVYGSVYFSNGLVETAPAHPGCDRELSFYCLENRYSGKPGQVWRYTVRRDGFVSQYAPYPGRKLTTKKFVFEGNSLSINFATSAFGHIDLWLEDESKRRIFAKGLFGDSTDRHVRFAGDLSAFAGKPVVLKAEMLDADFYSFKFDG